MTAKINEPCSIDGCDRPYKASGYCSKHHWSWWKYGDPLYKPTRTKPLSDRFYDYVTKTESCWLWSSTHSNGYGQIKLGNNINGTVLGDGRSKYRGAHIVAYELASGEVVPDGLVVCHTCDIPDCVRNDEPGIYVVDGVEYPRYGHLFMAPYLVNIHDMLAKNRQNIVVTQFGEDKPSSKLTNEQVIEIRQRFSNGETNKSALSREYGVSNTVIGQIISGKKWKFLLEEK